MDTPCEYEYLFRTPTPFSSARTFERPNAAAAPPLFPSFSLSVSRARPPFGAASFSRPKVLLKCITLNWKENSVKVQSVVHEREKRKAKEGATFFLFRRIPPTKGREASLSIIFFFPLPDNWQSAVSFTGENATLRIHEERKNVVRIKSCTLLTHNQSKA